MLQSYSENLDHCRAYEVLSTRLTRSGEGPIDSVILELRTWEFGGTFQQVDSRLSIALSRFKSEATLSMTALPAIPIQYAKQCTAQRLTQRGRMYYEPRNKKLVVHTGSIVGSNTYPVSLQIHYLLLELTKIAAPETFHDRHFHVQADLPSCD